MGLHRPSDYADVNSKHVVEAKRLYATLRQYDLDLIHTRMGSRQNVEKKLNLFGLRNSVTCRLRFNGDLPSANSMAVDKHSMRVRFGVTLETALANPAIRALLSADSRAFLDEVVLLRTPRYVTPGVQIYQEFSSVDPGIMGMLKPIVPMTIKFDYERRKPVEWPSTPYGKSDLVDAMNWAIQAAHPFGPLKPSQIDWAAEARSIHAEQLVARQLGKTVVTGRQFGPNKNGDVFSPYAFNNNNGVSNMSVTVEGNKFQKSAVLKLIETQIKRLKAMMTIDAEQLSAQNKAAIEALRKALKDNGAVQFNLPPLPKKSLEWLEASEKLVELMAEDSIVLDDLFMNTLMNIVNDKASDLKGPLFAIGPVNGLS